MRTLVVGGSSGLGLAIGTQLSELNHELIMMGRRPLDQLHSIPRNAQYRCADASDPLSITSAFDELAPNNLFLVAAAGLYLPADLSVAYEDLQSLFNIDAVAPIAWLLQAAHKLPPGGRIGWISSLSSRLPAGRWAVYAACKTAVEHFIWSTAPLMKERKLTVTICYPGQLQTTFHAAARAPRPTRAVDPRLVAPELVSAVLAGAPRYVAPMDRDLLTRLDAMTMATLAATDPSEILK
ncbi:MAG: SDR family oxidoreductase [Polyangiaceae bacterium]|nr:SDR family oxidoreductase [Polyangiaceae bacterium]